MTHSTHMRIIGFAAATFLAWPGVLLAQGTPSAWPTKPVKIIVPSGAGSAPDIMARELGAELQKRLGQPFVAENRAGAGGSIGSELCRQILAQNPKTLVLFELSEFALYAIERELTQLATPVQIIPILGSVLDFNKFLVVAYRKRH